MPDYAGGVTTSHVRTDYRFAPIPEDLLYDPEISHLAVRVYGVLMRHGLDPDHCFPSQRRISELVGAAQRSIARPLIELEAAGWVEKFKRTKSDGSPDSNGWWVRTSSVGSTRQNADLPAEERGPSPLVRAPNESNGNESKERPVVVEDDARVELPLEDLRAPSDEELFEEWWSVYPRKASKGGARAAYKSARRKTSAASLLEGARRYADDPNRDPSYTKHAATWLNSECWNDPPLPARRGPTRPQPVGVVVDEDRSGESGRVEL